MRAHIFLAPGQAAFGETQLGVALANALVGAGDRVFFLAPARQAALLRGQPFRWGTIDHVWGRIGAALQDTIASTRADDVVLVDACTTYLALAATDADPTVLDRLSVPLYALDLWNLIESRGAWDTYSGPWPIPPQAATVVRRLVPVPFVRPEGVRGAYSALPPPGPSPRRATRAELGLADATPLVLTTTARFQTLEVAETPYHRHLVTAVGDHFVKLLAMLGREVAVAHVGPLPLPAAGRIPGYRFLGQVDARRFDGIVAAADLLVTINLAATTVARALRHDVPTVVVINSVTLEDPAQNELAPLRPFSIWPLGLRDFMSDVLERNPFVEAIDTVELLDGARFVATCRALLHDRAARADAAARRARYVAKVDELPSALEMFQSYADR